MPIITPSGGFDVFGDPIHINSVMHVPLFLSLGGKEGWGVVFDAPPKGAGATM